MAVRGHTASPTSVIVEHPQVSPGATSLPGMHQAALKAAETGHAHLLCKNMNVVGRWVPYALFTSCTGTLTMTQDKKSSSTVLTDHRSSSDT